MKYAKFALVFLCIALGCAGKSTPREVASLPAEIEAVGRLDQMRAMWLSFPWWDLSYEKKKTLATYLAQKKINKVYLSIYDSGLARWNSKVLPESGIADSVSDDVLAESVKLFRGEGIQVAAFFEWGLAVSQDSRFYKQHPEWLQKCDQGVNSGEHGGDLMAFLDPIQKEPREILLKAVEELASHPIGFEEIQLDRFRYTRGEKWEICRASDGTSSPEHINALVRDAYQRIKAINPKILVSASPVGSYGFWKHNQRWGEWVKGGYIDAIVSQAYVPPFDLNECKRGTPITPKRQQTLAVFKGELASLSGRPDLLEEAISDLKRAGGDPKLLELDKRRPMVLVRQKELDPKGLTQPFSLAVGFSAYQYDDSECTLDQMRLAQRLGFLGASLWVSEVTPGNDGSPHPNIADNLGLLGETLWKGIIPFFPGQ